MAPTQFHGIFAAALTPMTAEGQVRPQDVPALLQALAQRGAHGALLLGTTGEGPSLAPAERRALLQAAVTSRPSSDFRLLAGTGTPSLEQTIALTRMAFDLGLDGVVVLPPYYFRAADDEGLFAWFAAVLQRGVPAGGALLAYHIPQVSGVALSLDLLARLKDAFPRRFVGLKDSSGERAFAEALSARFGADLAVFTGNDRLLTHAWQQGAAGAITALANVASPILRAAWDALRAGQSATPWQARLNDLRATLERLGPFAAGLKAVVPELLGWPRWGLKPPLRAPSPPRVAEVLPRLRDLLRDARPRVG